MARYTGPKCRKCRRYGVSLCGTAKCAIIRRPNPPGPRPMRRRKISDRGLQLIEKQKVRFAYGLMERSSAATTSARSARASPATT
jgi:small subunit ribosomal protein S4